MVEIINIVHLMYDDKFLDVAINQFEKVSNTQNLYIVLLPKKQQNLKYIKSDKVTIAHNIDEVISQISFLKSVDSIITHYFSKYQENIFTKIKSIYPKASITWLSWGRDFYQLINYPLLQKETERINKNPPIVYRIKSFLLKSHFEVSKKGIALIDYMATVLPNEYSLLAHLKGFRAKQVHFSYGDINILIPLSEDWINKLTLGNSILIGNSSTPENNHLDVFQIIEKEINSNDFQGQLLLPLSYGEKWYAQKVIEQGEQKFGGKFMPIVEFIPLVNYTKLLTSCSVAIFNHQRQQGIGNLLIMLYLGARVYLCETSPAFQYFTQNNICVYSLQTDFKKYKYTRLEDEKIIQNRIIINDLYGVEVIQNMTAILIDTLRVHNR